MTLAANDGGSGGALTINSPVTFTNLASTLKINFTGCPFFADQYTLIGDFATLAAISSATTVVSSPWPNPSMSSGTPNARAYPNFRNARGARQYDQQSDHSGSDTQGRPVCHLRYGRIDNLGLVNASVTGMAAPGNPSAR